MSASRSERKPPEGDGNGAGVPAWMAAVGIKPGEWLILTKSQLRAMQRPDRPLKVQVWATGMLHTAAYQGEEAFTMRNGKQVRLSASDIIKELHRVAIKFYTEGGLKLAPEQLAKLREDKKHIRRALESLEEDGVCQRTDKQRNPIRQLPMEVRERMHGATRLFFWAEPRRADPQVIAREWSRAAALLLVAEGKGPKSWALLPPIPQILKLFGIPQKSKADFEADPDFSTRVERGYLEAKKIFLEIVAGRPVEGPSGEPLKDALQEPLKGPTPGGAIERNVRKEQGNLPSGGRSFSGAVGQGGFAPSSMGATAPPNPPPAEVAGTPLVEPQNPPTRRESTARTNREDIPALCQIFERLQNELRKTNIPKLRGHPFAKRAKPDLKNQGDQTTLRLIQTALGSCPLSTFEEWLWLRVKDEERVPDKLGGFIQWAADCARQYEPEGAQGASGD